MFEISRRPVETNLPIITANYMPLLQDEFDILYCGTNSFGNKIIGSVLYQSFETSVNRRLHLIVDDSYFNKFIHQKITYRSLIEGVGEIFIIDESFDEEPLAIFNVEHTDIPAEYLPSAKSYCPEIENTTSLQYTLKLKGKLADLHEAVPHEISIISTEFSNVIQWALTTFNQILGTSRIHLKPFEPGSFTINYNIKVDPIQTLFTDEKLLDDIGNYLSLFLDYSLNYHLFENTSHEQTVTENIKPLIEIAEQVFEKTFIKKQALTPDVFAQISASALSFNEIVKQIGKNFTHIEVHSTPSNEGLSRVIGVMDEEFKKQFTQFDQTETIGPVKHSDSEYVLYQIRIFDLNTLSRYGTALVLKDNKLFQASIKIQGQKPLEGTEFTSSLHEKKTIDVIAKGTFIVGELKSLLIYFT